MERDSPEVFAVRKTDQLWNCFSMQVRTTFKRGDGVRTANILETWASRAVPGRTFPTCKLNIQSRRKRRSFLSARFGKAGKGEQSRNMEIPACMLEIKAEQIETTERAEISGTQSSENAN
jgi:hypothetical protein